MLGGVDCAADLWIVRSDASSALCVGQRGNDDESKVDITEIIHQGAVLIDG